MPRDPRGSDVEKVYTSERHAGHMLWTCFATAPLVLALSSMVVTDESYERPPNDVQVDPQVDPSTWVPRKVSLTARQRPRELGDKVVFINFDGAMMNGGCGDDPKNNCTTLFPGRTVLPYVGDKTNRAMLIQTLRTHVADFGISFTDTRPASGDYDMEMVGALKDEPPGGGGLAPTVDCWDGLGGEVSFTYYWTSEIVHTILQEAAHTWGLSHVDDDTDLLYQVGTFTPKAFRDECFEIVATLGGDDCSHHTDACGTITKQNSHAELLLIFGPSQPDLGVPTVQILAPSEAQTFPLGSTIDLRVALADDQTPMMFATTVTLEGNALAMPETMTASYAGPAELTFPLTELPDGTYQVTVEASDESGNKGSAKVSLIVGTGQGTSGSTSMTTDTDPASEDGTSGPTSASSTGSADETTAASQASNPTSPTTADSGDDDVGDTTSATSEDPTMGGDEGHVPDSFGGSGFDDGDRDGSCACSADRRAHAAIGLWLSLCPWLWSRRRSSRLASTSTHTVSVGS